MKNYEDYLPELLLRVPGCPEPTAVDALRRTSIEFCERTCAYRVVNDIDAIGPLDNEYSPVAPDHAEVFRILEVTIGGNVINPSSMEDMPGMFGGNWYAEVGSPIAWFQVDDKIRFVPLPNTTMELYTTVAYRPTATATAVPDSFFYEYYDAILDGTAYRLMLIPDKQWSRPGEAGVYASQYLRAISRALVDANKGRAARATLMARGRRLV